MFVDRHGRTWEVGLTVGDLPAVRRAAGADLGALLWGDGPPLWGDPDLLAAVLLAVVRPAGVTAEDFLDGLDGPAAGRAAEALAAAIDEFLPLPSDVPDSGGRAAPDAGPPDLEKRADELAGIVGIDPRPHTLRRLYRMAIERQRQAWQHTATVVAWTVGALNGKPPKLTDVAPPGLWPPPPPPKVMTEAEQAAHMEFTGRFMEQSWLAVYGGG